MLYIIVGIKTLSELTLAIETLENAGTSFPGNARDLSHVLLSETKQKVAKAVEWFRVFCRHALHQFTK
jgi:hypothetical protein